mmetsp:Transcript_11594/g.26796  ORF Transcript_11594/g.26796 Transcript_11594/m.26796 type:complete len:384 (-) Transcript_11594:513-1664(-)
MNRWEASLEASRSGKISSSSSCRCPSYLMCKSGGSCFPSHPLRWCARSCMPGRRRIAASRSAAASLLSASAQEELSGKCVTRALLSLCSDAASAAAASSGGNNIAASGAASRASISACARSSDGQSGAASVMPVVSARPARSSGSDISTREVGACALLPTTGELIPSGVFTDSVTSVSADASARPAVPSLRPAPGAASVDESAADCCADEDSTSWRESAGSSDGKPFAARSALFSSLSAQFSLCSACTIDVSDVTFVSSSSMYAFLRLRLIAADSRFLRMRLSRFSSAGSLHDPASRSSSPTSEPSLFGAGGAGISFGAAGSALLDTALLAAFTGVVAGRGAPSSAGRLFAGRFVKPRSGPVSPATGNTDRSPGSAGAAAPCI